MAGVAPTSIMTVSVGKKKKTQFDRPPRDVSPVSTNGCSFIVAPISDFVWLPPF
jgi:hypothetical protein